MIKFYDANGKLMTVPKEDYREKILPDNIKQAWHDSNKLYQLILMSLNDEFYSEMLAPAKRLLKIDSFKERSHTIMGIVYLKNDELRKAEKVLVKYCKKNGETGTILTNLAKVYYEMGENDRGFSTLERGLYQDPNQENGFTWYLSIIKEKYGESAVDDRIEEFAKLDNAWRPQLMYGAYRIRSGNKQEGLEIFTRIINKGIINEESLKIITGVLGEASMFEEALELTESIYKINNHGIPAGYNLLRIYESTQRYRNAIHLIDEMLQSGRVDIYQPLREYREKLEKLLEK